jgi:hypothetical protein
MASYSFRCSASSPARLIVAFFLAAFCLVAAHAQTKPERQSKAAKAAQSTQTAPSAQSAAASPSASDSDKEDSKPEEKAFKGMKYRLIGPFRGARSITAAGIPGDHTTY